MKYQSRNKTGIFFICCFFCFLVNTSVSEASQSTNELTEKNFSEVNNESIEDVLQEKEITPVVQSIVLAKDIMVSSFHVKVSLTERLKAFLSLREMDIMDIVGRDIGNNYNAVFGFQIQLQ